MRLGLVSSHLIIIDRYRRSIAKDVWGTDDPKTVAEKIGAGTNSWDTFFSAAAELKAKGYGIVSGDGDIWHAVENSPFCLLVSLP